MTGRESNPGERGKRDRLLRVQKHRGFNMLRFFPSLEGEFHSYYRNSGRPFRLILLALALIAIIAQPFYGWLGHQHADTLIEAVWLFLYAVEVASLIAAIIVTARRPVQESADRVLGITALLLACILLLEHALGAVSGVEVPLQLVGIVVVAVFFVARLRYRTFFPFAVLVAVAIIASEAVLTPTNFGSWAELYPLFLLIGLAFIGGYAQEYMVRGAWLDNALLAFQSDTDGLTGLLNHRAAYATAQSSLDEAARTSSPLGLAMIDIDHFKGYNDRHGHIAGDECLISVAETLRQTARRDMDCVGRLGGEEFIVVWHGARPDDVERMAGRLLDNVRDGHTKISDEPPVTISLGLVTISPGHHMQVGALIDLADQLMYRAKQAGRDQMAVEHLGETAQLSRLQPAARA